MTPDGIILNNKMDDFSSCTYNPLLYLLSDARFAPTTVFATVGSLLSINADTDGGGEWKVLPIPLGAW